MPGRVENYLMSRLAEEGALHLALIDPDKASPNEAEAIAEEAAKAGSAAVMVGGSLGVSENLLDQIVLAAKKSGLPTIIFPSNATTLSKYADAVWFMSLLNSSNTYFIVDAQMIGAAIVKKYGLEPIPMGYLVLNLDSAVGFVGQVRPIPPERPEIAALYALTAQYMGMRFVYLEGGSGAKKTVPAELVSKVRENVGITLVVGGGIRTGEDARRLVEAGADILVTGTVLEESAGKMLSNIIDGVREGVKKRRGR